MATEQSAAVQRRGPLLLDLDNASLARIAGETGEIWGYTLARVCKRLRAAVFAALGHYPWGGNSPPPQAVVDEIFRMDDDVLMANLAHRGKRFSLFSPALALQHGAPRCLLYATLNPAEFPLEERLLLSPAAAGARVRVVVDFICNRGSSGEQGERNEAAVIERYLVGRLPWWMAVVAAYLGVCSPFPPIPGEVPAFPPFLAARMLGCVVRDRPNVEFKTAVTHDAHAGELHADKIRALASMCAAHHSRHCFAVLPRLVTAENGCGFNAKGDQCILNEALCPAQFRTGFVGWLLRRFWPLGEVELLTRALAIPELRRRVGKNSGLLEVLRELETLEDYPVNVAHLWPVDVSVRGANIVFTFTGTDIEHHPNEVSPEYLIAIIERLAPTGWRRGYCSALVKQGSRKCAIYAYQFGCLCKAASVSRAIEERDLELLELGLRRRGRDARPSKTKKNATNTGAESPASAPKGAALTDAQLMLILRRDLRELLEVVLKCRALSCIKSARGCAEAWKAKRCLELLPENGQNPLALAPTHPVAAAAPTEEEIDTLAPGQYVLWKDKVHVKASRVGRVHVHYICPFCYTRIRKDGEPHKGAKRIEHQHGSGNNKANHVDFERIMHCVDSQMVKSIRHPDSIVVHVTPSTQRY